MSRAASLSLQQSSSSTRTPVPPSRFVDFFTVATVWPGSLPSCSLASSRSHGQHSDRDILSRAAGAAGGRFPTHCQTVTASDSSSPDPPAGHGHPIISCQDSDQAATPRVRPGTDETGPAGLGGSARLPCCRIDADPGSVGPGPCHPASAIVPGWSQARPLAVTVTVRHSMATARGSRRSPAGTLAYLLLYYRSNVLKTKLH